MFAKSLFGERHDQNAVGGGNAHTHDCTHQRRHTERGMSEKQEDHDAGQRGGQSRNDDKRIEPGLKIYNDQQVDQDDGEAEASQQADIGRPHRGELSPDRDKAAARQ